jgi:PAS domain S-box-containing protein
MEGDLDRRVRERTRELEEANQALRRREQALAANLDAARRLQYVATQLLSASGVDALYEQILDATQAILHSDFASIQIFYPERGTNGELRLQGHRGFSEQAAKRWEWISPAIPTCCGEALRAGRRVAVPDVKRCDFMAGSEDLEVYLGAGIHAVQTTPLVSRSGALLGMLSTHWREPHDLAPDELQALDVLARLAADLIERSQSQEALRRSEERFRQVAESAGEFIWEVDANGLYLYVSPVVEQILGYAPEELVGKMGFYDLLVPESRDSVTASWFEIMARREPLRAFPSLRTKRDGTIVTVETSGVPIKDRNGNFIGYRGVSKDVTERTRAEEKLRESEERFRHMADTAPVMIWVSGPDKLCTFFNKPWLDFTRRTLEQELGNGWADSVHPGDLDRCLATYSSSFDARRPFQMEYRLRRADGEYRWILDHGTPHYRHGEFAGFIGSGIDITEQMLLAERLQAQTVQFTDAQRLAKMGSWERHLDSGTIDWSGELFRIFGLSDNPPPTLAAFLTHVHPKDRERVLAGASDILSSAAPIELPCRILRADGEVRFVRAIVEAIRDHRGVAVRTVGSLQDITEEVQAGQLLRESEARLKNAERLAHVGHWEWNLKTNHVSGSEEMYRIFGKPQGYVPSHEGFLQDLLPEDRDQVERLIKDSLAGKMGHSVEYRAAHPNGDLRTISCVWEVLLDEEGLPARLFGTCQDITDVRRAQQESFARQKLESVGTLARGIAHDFNNILGSTLAQAELALAELAAGSNPEEQLKRIRDVALHGSEIVRELMVYAGSESAASGVVDLSHVVKEMIELFRVTVSKRAVLETDLARDLPAVRANASQLSQIVMNLVTNASDAIGNREGVIRVTTRRLKEEGRFGAASDRVDDGDYVRLEVSDTGSGMSAETQAKVFDPFFTTKSAGQGLGLAIVHGIVRNLGGSIHLTSELGRGTSLRILLPCAQTSDGATSNPIPANQEVARPSPDVTVLVVEDENALRQAVVRILRKTGYQVFEAPDAFTAIELVRAHRDKFDLILLDVTTPGPSSQEVVAEAVNVRPEVKVVLTSAYSQEMIADAMRAPQIHSFLRKPFRLAELIQALRNALSS